MTLSENITRLLFLLMNFTLPDALRIFVSLLYTKFSAIISFPLSVSAFPFFEPTIRFPP